MPDPDRARLSALTCLLDLLLPPRCGGCLRPGAWLCAACRGSVRRLEEPLCRRCGRELASSRASCGCRANLRALARCRAAAAYEGPLERALQRFKYRGWRAMATPLGELLCDRLAVEVPAGSVVLAVPLHPSRLGARGYNQAELLARHLRRRLRLPAPSGRLVRVRATPPQVGLDRPRRRANVEGAFAWRGPGLGGSPLVVVDDVVTTGATLDACAAALRAAGSGSVSGLSVARVVL